MNIRTAIKALESLHGDLLFDLDEKENNGELKALDNTSVAVQFYLKGLADIEKAKANLELADVFLAREISGNF
jgi:hypothetical protein